MVSSSFETSSMNDQQPYSDDYLDLDSIDTVLGTARSVRRNLDFERAVEPEVLFDCIDLCTQAPTGLVGEHWRFVVATDPELKRRLAQLYGEVITELVSERGVDMKPTQRALVERLPDIPAMIFVCAIGAPPGPQLSTQVAYFGSILPAAWSLMLALRARRIGTTWTSVLSTRQDEVATLLGMPEDVVQTVMLPVAYMKGAKLRRADRLGAREVTYWNTWGNGHPE